MARPNNGPRLARNKTGVWEIRWPENGVTRRRSTGSKDHGFAQKILGQFLLLENREQALKGDGPMLVIDALGTPDVPGEDYWNEHVVPKVICKASARYAIVKLTKHFGPIAICDIVPKDVDLYVNARRTGAIGRPSVNHTISKELSFLIAAINHAVKAKRLPKADQPHIALPGTSPPRDVWLSEVQADRLLAKALVPNRHSFGNVRKIDQARLPRVYRFIALVLGTASRKTALLTLKWGQVDFETKLIFLNPTGRAQTRKRRSTVPISDELLPVLQRAHKERTGEFVLDHAGCIRSAFESAVKRAGLPATVTPHTLRHTWATWAARSGRSFYEIAAVMGDTIATVQRVYQHHAPEYLVDAVNNVRPSSQKKADTQPELKAVV